MALNFTLFDPTYQTSNFYSAIAKIERNSFKEDIYEVFEGARKYAVFTDNSNIAILKDFFQKNSINYKLMGETVLDKGGLLIVQTDITNLSLPILLKQAEVSQEVKGIL